MTNLFALAGFSRVLASGTLGFGESYLEDVSNIGL
jgi:hypothetical protein